MQEIKRLLNESKRYTLFIAFVLVVGAWLGYVYSQMFEAIIMQMLEQLMDVKEELDEKDSVWYTAWFIFQNNVRASFLMMGMGLFLFFVPIFTIFANGLALGYVLKITVEQGLPPIQMFVFGILPHGVLELPAVVIAGALGLFMGLRILRWFFGKGKFFSHLLGFGSERRSVREFWQEETLPVLNYRIKALVNMIVAIVLVLAVAALIESFITPVLILQFIGGPLS